MDFIGKLQTLLGGLINDGVVIGVYVLLGIGMAKAHAMTPEYPYKSQVMVAVERTAQQIIYHLFGQAQVRTLIGIS